MLLLGIKGYKKENRMKKIVLAVLLCVTVACKDDNNPGNNEENNLSEIYLPDREVYVSGWETINGKQQHVIWKNGDLSILESNENLSTEASNVFVEGNDVYASGYEGLILCAWKNNKIIRYPQASATSYSNQLFVNSSNVYILHDQSSEPKYTQRIWKNNTVLQTSSPGINTFTQFKVVNNDVFIAGSVDTGVNKTAARLWKNNQLVNTQAIQAEMDEFVFVDYLNNDRFVVGAKKITSNNIQYRIFKNDNLIHTLIIDKQASFPIFRLTETGNMYTAVAQYINADDTQFHFYKNSTQVSILQSNNHKFLNDFYVYKESLYCLYEEEDVAKDYFVPKIWKDGKTSTISTSTNKNRAFSIFVKAK